MYYSFCTFLVIGGSAAYLVNLLGIAPRSPLAYLVLFLVCMAFVWIFSKLAEKAPTNNGTKTTTKKPGGGFGGGGSAGIDDELKEMENIDIETRILGDDSGFSNWFDGDD